MFSRSFKIFKLLPTLSLAMCLAFPVSLKAGAEGDPVSEAPVANRTLNLPLGQVDAVTGQLSFRIPLGPKLPGRIPLGFIWAFDSGDTGNARTAGSFKPVVWPGVSTGPIQVTVVVEGEPWAFYRQAKPAQMPSQAQILQWAQDRGVRLAPGTPSLKIFPSSDGTKFYVEFTFLPDTSDDPGVPSSPLTTAKFVRAILTEDSAIWARGNAYGVGVDGVTHFTNRWGDKVSVTESNFIGGWLGDPQQITISNDLNGQSISLAVTGDPTYDLPPSPYYQTYGNAPQPGALPRNFWVSGATISITNTLKGDDGVPLPAYLIKGQINGRERMDTTSYPGPPVIDINTGIFDEGVIPTSITAIPQGGNDGPVTTNFSWETGPFTWTPAMSGASFSTLLATRIQSVTAPSGASETFIVPTSSDGTFDMSPFWRVNCWDSATGLWKGVASFPNMTNPSFDGVTEGIPGIFAIRIDGGAGVTGKYIQFVRDSPILLWRYDMNDPPVHPYTTSVLTFAGTSASGTYRGVRFTHPSSWTDMVGQTDLRSYLFATQTVLAEEQIHGSGTYDPSNPTAVLSGAVTDQVTVHDGWSLKSWANPSGVLSTTNGIPVTAVALRTRTWTLGSGLLGVRPTRTTIASGFDGWGPTQTDDYADDPSAGDAAPSVPFDGGQVGTFGDIPVPESLSSNSTHRVGKIHRHWDNPANSTSLMRLLTDDDQKTLGGSALPRERFSLSAPGGPLAGVGSVDFGKTAYGYDSLGRMISEEGDRGGFSAIESRSYLPGLPLVSDTTKHLLQGAAQIPGNLDAQVQVGKTYTYADTVVQSGPSAILDKVDGRAETFSYDALGRVTQHTDAQGVTTDTAYDAWGRVVSVRREGKGGAASLETDSAYDPNTGLKTSETMVEGDTGRALTTRTAYDTFGRVVKVTGPDGSYQTFQYDGWGEKISASPVLKPTMASWGNERWIYDAIGQVTDHYDAQGRQVLHVLQQPGWGTATGNVNGVPATVAGIVTRTQSDWDIRNNAQRVEIHDLLGQKTGVVDQAGNLTRYWYDQDGHLLQTRQGSQIRTYTYNEMGWLTSRTEPEEGTTAYSGFNLFGTPKVTTQNGTQGSRVFTTTFDLHLQPSEILAQGPEGTVDRKLKYDYGAANTHLLTDLVETQTVGSLSAQTVSESYGYDPLGRLVSKTIYDGDDGAINPQANWSQAFTVSQSLDASGKVASLTYPSGGGLASQVATTDYDALDRPSQVKLNGALRGLMLYGAGAQSSVVDTLIYGNNAQTVSTTTKGELVRTQQLAGGTTVEDNALTWTAGGLMLSRGNDTFDYDPLQRLNHSLAWDGSTGATTEQWYAYDAYGNRTQNNFVYTPGQGSAQPSEVLAWSADPAAGVNNRLPGTLTQLTPGAPGDPAVVASGTYATGAQYDDLGRMTQVWTTPGQVSTQTTWVYDPSGRVMEENGTAYLLDASGLRFKRFKADGSGAVDYTVYGFNREPLAQFEIPARTTGGTTTTTSSTSSTLTSTSKPSRVKSYIISGGGGDGGGSYPPAGATIVQPASDVTVGLGQSVTFQGSSTYGTAYSWAFGDGATATTLSATHAFTSVGTYAVVFKATASGYTASQATVNVTVVAKPSITGFTASPASILTGQSTTLAWSVSGATSLALNQGIGTVSGTSLSVAPTATTTYTLTATNVAGSVTATVTVGVSLPPPPTITSFTASPATIGIGSSTTLSWAVANGTTVSLDQGIGAVTGTSRAVSPSQSTTYTLTATNTSGSATASITVAVETQPPFITDLWSDPYQLSPSQNATLHWNASLADSLSLNGSPVTGTTASISPNATTTYTLTATNLVGSVSATVTVSVGTPGALVWKKTMVYGFGQELSEDQPGMGTTFIQGDFVGSPSVMTDASGAVVGRSKNLPFGERFGQWGQKTVRRYTNHEDDTDSGAIYMQAREYLPAYGKFAEVDPAYDQTKDDPESWNLYNYVTNNPVTKTDPDGRMTVTPGDMDHLYCLDDAGDSGGSSDKPPPPQEKKSADPSTDPNAGRNSDWTYDPWIYTHVGIPLRTTPDMDKAYDGLGYTGVVAAGVLSGGAVADVAAPVLGTTVADGLGGVTGGTVTRSLSGNDVSGTTVAIDATCGVVAGKVFRALSGLFSKGAPAASPSEPAAAPEPGGSGGRGKNKLAPDPQATGDHSTFKRGPDGKVSNHAEYTPNPKNPSGFQQVKRVDVSGKAHTNPDGTVVPTPHVKEAGTRGVRPARPDELP